jgi:EmrB/QacA subfamily drug resistance transporter
MTVRTAGQPALAPAPDSAHAKRWLILVVLGIAQLMVVLDATIVNIALPAAQTDIGFSNDNRQWVVTGYALAFGSLLLLGGRLSDMFGRRVTFLTGLAGFALASAIGGAATTFELLIAARVGQGVFGALLAPAALSLLSTTFTDPDERGKAFGIYGAIAGGGGAAGLLLGGVLTEYSSWRWCLYVNLIFAGVALVAGAILLPRQAPGDRPKLDLPGTLTVTAGLFGIVYGFAQAESAGWGAASTLSWLATGVVLIAVFVVLELRVSHPLLPLRVILDRNRGGSYLAMLVAGAGAFAIFLFLTYFLQVSLGFSPVQTGLGFLPMIGVLAVTASVATSMLLPRLGARPLVPTGMFVAAGGILLLTRISLESSYVTGILPGLMLVGLGMGLIFAPAMQGAVSGVEAHDAGVASAMVNTMQQIGGSIGTALLSTIAASAATNYLTDAAPSAGLSQQALAAQAAVESYVAVFWWAAIIFAIGGVITGLVLRSGPLAKAAEGAAVIAH